MKSTILFKGFFFILSITLILNGCKQNSSISITNQQEALIDSVSTWVKASKNRKKSLESKKEYLNKAYKNLINRNDDTLKARNLSIVAYRYRELKDSLLFHTINKEAQELAYQLKDSFTIADTHWSLANYYNGAEIYDKSYFHYNSAYKYFNGIQKEYLSARMLYSMSYIKGRYRDFSESEVLVTKAIKSFKKLKKYRYLYFSYEHLALLQNDIKEHDKALTYNNKALNYLEKVQSKKKYYEVIFNNIGMTYLKKGKINKAKQYFKKALSDNISVTNYARALSNLAFCRLRLEDTTNVKEDFYRALFIRDSVKSKAGIVASKIRISDYYKYVNDTSKAIQYAKEASVLAKKIKNGGEYLRTLKQLADLEPLQSEKHLNTYIQFSDSLHNAERKVQNKFTRIEFETDEHIEESKRLSEQTIIISITSVGLILILSLAYFLRTQKAKNEKLVLEAEQQKANEQVYLLTLEQQAIIEEERVQERNRISEELHDGVLGRLFGTRVGLGFLDLNASDETEKQHESFLEELQEIEKEIRDVSHKLSNNFSADQINFSTLIQQLLKTNSVTGSFKYQVSFDEAIEWKNISQLIKINIYRVVQESLQNIVKSAKAKNVILDFSIKKTALVVYLKDDGVGFDMKRVKKGIGIKNMKSRIQKLKGTLEIESKVEQGTSISIEIPVIN